MKKIALASAMMASVAMANDVDSRPEASVSTPVERLETVNSVPNFTEKENVDWQKLREERRVAREQILRNLKENSAAEKNAARDVQQPPPAPEKMVGKEPMPKDDFVRDQKQNEKQWMDNQLPPPSFGGPMNRFDQKKWPGYDPSRQFDPRRSEKFIKGEMPKRENIDKGLPPRK